MTKKTIIVLFAPLFLIGSVLAETIEDKITYQDGRAYDFDDHHREST